MKKILLVIALSICCVSPASMSFGQDAATPQFAPLTEIKKAFEAPPDMLDATLKKVKKISSDPAQKTGDAISSEDIAIDDIKNPFTPQTPQENKEIVIQNIIPTETPVPTKPALVIPQFTLSGLVWNTGKPAAILNGKIVAIGDEVSSWAVTQITKEGVEVTYEDQNLWVKPVVDPNNAAAQANQRNNR
jgi:hypothetical protein